MRCCVLTVISCCLLYVPNMKPNIFFSLLLTFDEFSNIPSRLLATWVQWPVLASARTHKFHIWFVFRSVSLLPCGETLALGGRQTSSESLELIWCGKKAIVWHKKMKLQEPCGKKSPINKFKLKYLKSFKILKWIQGWFNLRCFCGKSNKKSVPLSWTYLKLSESQLSFVI